MAQPTLARIAQSLRPSRRKADVPDADADLLARFVKSRDEAAFRALVHRHGKTVLTACRQVLADPADVDDAFQAAFLVLLKKAKAVDGSTPLGGWLFAVAHRVAVKCRADKARRRTREAEAARHARTTTELPDLSWREAAAVLHAELNALPDRYRLPLLLCGVQGLTRDEAADQLGTTVGAVRGQLERGRTLLERRLTKRGVVLSAGLLAVLMGGSRAAGGPSPELIDLAVRAAGGNASSAVAALAHGAFPMTTTTLKQMILPAVLALGLVGTGVGFGTPATADDKPAQEMKKPAANPGTKKESKADVKERTISGKVVGENGQPVQAELTLVWQEGKEQPLGKTRADGTFKLTVPVTRGGPGGYLVAAAAGHGSDFLLHGQDWKPQSMTPTVEVTFKLPKERPIKGRVLDQQGKPVAGATVTAKGVSAFNSSESEAAKLKEWAVELFLRGVPPTGDRWRSFPPGDQSPPTATADKDGRFTLAGFGVGQLVRMKVTGPGIADTEVISLNRDGFDPEPTNKQARAHEFKEFGGKWWLAGPDPVVAAETEKLIRGTVTDHEGKPRAGVSVVFSRTNKRDLNPDYNQAVTDKDGKYEIRGAKKHKGYMVEVAADPTAGLLQCQAFADDTVGYEPITIDVKQAKGVVVTGRVTNKATGKPLRAQLYAEVLNGNPFVDKYPPMLHRASMASEQDQAGADGVFRLVTIPGPVILMAGPRDDTGGRFKPVVPDPKHPDKFTTLGDKMPVAIGYGQTYTLLQGNWCRVIEAKEKDAEIMVNIELEPATETLVKVVDADGKPITGFKATGVDSRDFAHPTDFPDTDTLTVYNLEPKTERLVAVAHDKRKLVGTLALTADTKDPVVKLGAAGTVTGRVVGPDGKPRAGLYAHLHYDRREVSEAAGGFGPSGLSTSVETNANGEFTITGVFPGQQFQLYFHSGKRTMEAEHKDLPKQTVAKHGDTLKLGDVKLEPANEGGE